MVFKLSTLPLSLILDEHTRFGAEVEAAGPVGLMFWVGFCSALRVKECRMNGE